MRKLFILFTLPLSLLACQAQQRTASNTNSARKLTQTQWQLVEVNGQKLTEEQKKGAYILLEDSSKHIMGNSGCNSIYGAFNIINNKKIQLKNMGISARDCSHPDLEKQLIYGLMAVDSYELSDNGLILSQSNGRHKLRFEAAASK
jgi:heat shock protein HslJ